MIETSTPRPTSSDKHTSIPSECDHVTNFAEPRQTTIDFLRQFARCYIAAPIASSAAAVILN
ncbi:MAG: hypothetical protein J6C77_02120 [Muribaculaceae bacterium]|nr:hypothetical protein [Muribaculaceae bacterium]